MGALAVAVLAGSLAGRAQQRSVTLPQAPLVGGGATRAPDLASPEVRSDGRVTFRIFAPSAEKVELRSPGDIPGINFRGVPPHALMRHGLGVWETTVGPLSPGAYRYVFVINDVPIVDSRNPATSQTNTTVYSLAIVPGSDLFDTKNVPHGAVAAVHYYSTALGGTRRMHVYTPPGYDANRERYPVLYLLHGSGDVDQSWSTVGRAGFILDNLIAAHKAKPMIVVMPSGHVTGAGAALGGKPPVSADAVPGNGGGPDPFAADFMSDLVPYVEKNYRALTDRQSRAIAGLSMGGNQTLNIAIAHLDRFAFVGVFSSGLISARIAPPSENERFAETWEGQHLAALDNAALKRGLGLLWFGTGQDDFLIDTTRMTIRLFEKHGFKPVFLESQGGHTWLNWRDYLAEFAPQLFQIPLTQRARR